MEHIILHELTPSKNKNQFILDNRSFHHLIIVRRQKPGSVFYAVVNNSVRHRCRICSINKSTVEFIIEESENISASLSDTPAIEVVQALIKPGNFALIIQKCTEIGIDKIIPLISFRSQNLGRSPQSFNTGRWEKVADEAAKQSGQIVVPEIEMPAKGIDKINLDDQNCLNLFLHSSNFSSVLKKILARCQNDTTRIRIFIGPEGGWDLKEIEWAMDNKINFINLGKSILRAETACITAVSFVRQWFLKV